MGGRFGELEVREAEELFSVVSWNLLASLHRSCFDHYLYLPPPSYPSLVMLWTKAIQGTLDRARRARRAKRPIIATAGGSGDVDFVRTEDDARLFSTFSIPDDFDISSLAHVSVGYSAGSVVKAVNSTLTKRRLEKVCAYFVICFAQLWAVLVF